MLEETNSSSAEEISARQEVLNKYLNSFQKECLHYEGIPFSYKEDAPQLLTSLYFRYANQIMRPPIDSQIIQHFKIISATESTIMFVSPIIHEDEKKGRFLNARLAFYVSLRLLLEWNYSDLNSEKCADVIKHDREISSFLKEHLTWLVRLNPNYYNPVFYNAQVWRLFYYLLKEKTI